MSRSNFPAHAIAIVGLAGRFPQARDLDEFWKNIREGVDCFESFDDATMEGAGVPKAVRDDPRYVRGGTVLAGADLFDAGFFGFSPREAQALDPQQRIFLECAWEALEHAGYAPGAEASVGVYAGAGMNTYLLTQLLRNPATVEAIGGYQLMLASDKDFLCTRVSYKLDLRGPSMTIQTACSTSLVAVAVACRALARGECDIALAGGVAIPFPQRGGYLYQDGMILSPDGRCRPFDAAAGGIRPGSGCGVVTLKRLSDAIADGDTIHAVIRGAAVNNDGSGKAGYTAPSIEGQVEVIATAQALAGVEARSISYVEAHGTATPLGDPIEVAALTEVFGASSGDKGFCRLGSLKANLGHLDAAAGVASLIKTVFALEHRELPPLVNFRTPNPQLGLGNGPFMASASAAQWATGATPRRAGVSSFGIGGTNAHVVLEEAPASAAAVDESNAQLLVLSARTPAALDAATANLAAHLQRHPEQALADVAWTLQAGRKPFAHRRIVVARDHAQALARLAEPHKAPVHSGQHEGGARQVAFLFSGQGSQHAGMGAELHRTERVFREAVDRCCEILRPHLGLDLREAMFAQAGDEKIDETRLAQPALFVTEYALATLWASWGVRPAAMMGHSIGEYVAAHLAGVMSLEDALAVVAARGALMQALPAGSMAALHLGADDAARRIAGRGIEVAAVNAPNLCTVSGPSEAVAKLLAELGAQGVDSRALHTSHAFHSAMMEPALAPFRERLAKVRLAAPQLPYVSNVTGTWIKAEEATSPDYYARHLRGTVRFEAGMRALAADPAMHFLEVGPGNVLASLARMSLSPDGARRVTASMGHAREERPQSESMREAAGRLWLAGVPIEWTGLHDAASRRRVPLPTYPFERSRHWVDATTAAAPAARAQASPEGMVRHDDVTEWFHVPTWARGEAMDAVPTPVLAGTWIVAGGGEDIAAAVASRLSDAGARVIRIDASEEAARPERYSAIASEARAANAPVGGAIILWSLVDDATAPADKMLYLYYAQVAMAAGLGIDRDTPARVVVATAGAQSVLDEKAIHPEGALALGPVLSLPVEVPGLSMRVVDVARKLPLADVSGIAASLVREAEIDDREEVTALRSGRRWLRRYEPARLKHASGSNAPALKPRGVYLITGGLGGIGLALALDFARRAQARLLLTSRRGEPDAAQREAIRAIEAAGGEVRVAKADAADAHAMAAAIDQARAAWGAIDGVVHAAGIVGAPRLSILKTPAEVDAVLSPKAGGLDVLVRILGATPLDFVVLLSSTNTMIPAAGVAEYAAANAVLDAFVDSSRRPAAWKRVISLLYFAWGETGLATRLEVVGGNREAWHAFLRSGIDTANGVEGFARVLASGLTRAVVMPYDATAAVRRARAEADALINAAATDPGATATEAQPRGASAVKFEGLETDAERQIAAIWAELLGVDRIGADDDFFELGGHSLAATRVLARIEAALGVRLALRDIFEAPTVRKLAAKAGGSRGGAAANGQPQEDREELEF